MNSSCLARFNQLFYDVLKIAVFSDPLPPQCGRHIWKPLKRYHTLQKPDKRPISYPGLTARKWTSSDIAAKYVIYVRNTYRWDLWSCVRRVSFHTSLSSVSSVRSVLYKGQHSHSESAVDAEPSARGGAGEITARLFLALEIAFLFLLESTLVIPRFRLHFIILH